MVEHQVPQQDSRGAVERVALVTGAAGGLGRSIAIDLARQGFDLVVTARDVARLSDTVSAIRDIGRTAYPHALDLHDVEVPTALAAELAASGVYPEVLVNNGGVGGPSGPLWELPVAEWKDTLDVNVTGTFACCRAFLPAMVERRRGAIITLGSATGKATLPGRTAYATSKLALVGLTRTLAVDAGPFGVRVNLVSPANVEGDRLQWALAARARSESTDLDDVASRMSEQAALKRFVDPNEVATTVSFLASDAASAITGEDINVSAGYVMY